jgi:transcriptional regulator with XRE-family HTH domain
MRSSFGQLAASLRQKRRLTQTEFAKLIDESIARVSNLEHYRTNIGDDVINKYLKFLASNAEEGEQLRAHAQHSNLMRKHQTERGSVDRIRALLDQYGKNISEDSARKMLEILETDVGGEVSHLRLKNTKFAKTAKTPARFSRRPVPSTIRYVEIALIAEEIRLKHCDDSERLDVIKFLDAEINENENLDFDILRELPSYAQGAFACITGTANGNVILATENGVLGASRGDSVNRHVLMHEFGHSILHGDFLVSENTSYLPVQELAKTNVLNVKNLESGNGRRIDTLVEAEAELFATMILVPWYRFYAGTDTWLLGKDYGEEKYDVDYHAKLMHVKAVKSEFKRQLWNADKRDHPIFLSD